MRYFELIDGVGQTYYEIDDDERVRTWHNTENVWFYSGAFDSLSDLLKYVRDMREVEDVSFTEVTEDDVR